MGQTGLGQELGHLCDVAEHVGQVADLHHGAERAAAQDALLQVPHDGLAGHQELVHEDVPGPDGDPAGGGQGAQAPLVLGADLQVVVDHGQLAVQQEVAVGAVLLHQVQQVVDEADELQPEGLERVVPLPVPVGVGHDGNPSAGARRRAVGPRGHCSRVPYSAS